MVFVFMNNQTDPCKLRASDFVPGYGFFAYPSRIGKARAESFVNDVKNGDFYRVDGVPFGNSEPSLGMGGEGLLVAAYNLAFIFGGIATAYAAKTGMLEKLF